MDGVVFDKATADGLIAMLLDYRSGRRAIANAATEDESLIEYTQFYNDSGEEIPPYGCCQIVGKKTVDGVDYLKVEKPSSFLGDLSKFLINRGEAVEDKSIGTAQTGSQFQVFRDPNDDTEIEFGLHWMPVLDEWYVERSDGGIFSGVDEVDADEDEESFRVVFNYVEEWVVEFDAQIASGDNDGVCTVLDAYTEAPTTTEFTGIKNPWSDSLPSNTGNRCTVKRDPMSGKLIFGIEDC